MDQTIPIVILAAGASRRLGSAKQLVRFRGRSLLAHAVSTARGSVGAPVLVVLGARIEELRAEVAEPDVRVLANPDWADGMGSSVRVAISAIEADHPDAPGALFLVADQPLVTSDLLDDLIRAFGAGHCLVAAAYAGAVGVPALFHRRFFAELRDLSGDSGARRVLARHAGLVHALPFPGGVVDVDTPADATRLAELTTES